MGGQASTCPLDISDYPLEVNGGNTILMTYGAKVVIPLEIGFPMLRTSSFALGSNDRLLERSLDLVEEQRQNAMVQLAYY